eukprot:3145916-Alexandrium_andersonii.AAC.1
MGPRLAVPRAGSAKRASSSEGRQAPAEEATTLTYAKEALKVVDFGGNGDCGYRALACVAAVNARRQELKYFEEEEGRAWALKFGKTLRATCAMHISKAEHDMAPLFQAIS